MGYKLVARGAVSWVNRQRRQRVLQGLEDNRIGREGEAVW